MRRMKKRGPNVLYDLNDLLFFLTLPQASKQASASGGLAISSYTRKLGYRKDDRAMLPIFYYGCSEKFRESPD